MDIPDHPFEGTTRPLVKRSQRKSQARTELSPEYQAHDLLAERVTAVVVTGLDGFLVRDGPTWPMRLQKIEKAIEQILVSEHVSGR